MSNHHAEITSTSLDEILRVLRPHGVLVLADIANIREYRTHLTSQGVTDMRTVLGGAEAVIMGAVSGELSPAGT